MPPGPDRPPPGVTDADSLAGKLDELAGALPEGEREALQVLLWAALDPLSRLQCDGGDEALDPAERAVLRRLEENASTRGE